MCDADLTGHELLEKVVGQIYISVDLNKFRLMGRKDETLIDPQANLSSQGLETRTELVLVPSAEFEIRRHRRNGYVSC